MIELVIDEPFSNDVAGLPEPEEPTRRMSSEELQSLLTAMETDSGLASD